MDYGLTRRKARVEVEIPRTRIKGRQSFFGFVLSFLILVSKFEMFVLSFLILFSKFEMFVLSYPILVSRFELIVLNS